VSLWQGSLPIILTSFMLVVKQLSCILWTRAKVHPAPICVVLANEKLNSFATIEIVSIYDTTVQIGAGQRPVKVSVRQHK
jgi:hypothetical protein